MNSEEIFNKIQKHISKDVFGWIIKDVMTVGQLKEIASTCGLKVSADGEPEARQLNLISYDVSNEYYKNSKVRILMHELLLMGAQNEIKLISETTFTEIIRLIQDNKSHLFDRGCVGKYLWALLMDQRPELVPLIPLFVLKVNEKVRQFTEILDKFSKKPLGPSAPLSSKLQNLKNKKYIPKPDWEKDLDKKNKEVQEAKDDLKRIQEKNDILLHNNEQVKTENKRLLTVEQDLKKKLHECERIIKDHEINLKELKIKIEESARATQNFHQLEREYKKLTYEHEKLKIKLESTMIPQEDSLLQEYQQKMREKDESVHELKKELDNVRKENEKFEIKINKLENQLNQIMPKENNVVRSSGQRVGIFVDVQNVFYAAKRMQGKLDYNKLLAAALRGRVLSVAYAYVIRSPENPNPGFWDALADMGFTIRSKDLHVRQDGTAKGNWDMGMAMDAVRLHDRLDIAVLVTGDGDFVDLMKLLQAEGLRVEILSFPHNTASELIDQADQYIPIEPHMLMMEN